MRIPVLSLLLSMAALAAHAQGGPWQMEPSETTADLRGIHAAGGGVVWASGTGGTVLRSEDSGFEWQQCAVPPGAEKLDFRAIWGFDDEEAVVMSSGPGDQSRLYRTTDGCAHWTLVFTNPEPNGFYDGLVFLDRQHGFVIGDPTSSNLPVEGGYFTFRIRATDNGGNTWVPVVYPMRPVPGKGLSPFPDESLFAASNSSAIANDGHIRIGTSGARVLEIAAKDAPFANAFCAGALDPYSHACGIPWMDWTSTKVPMPAGKTAGIFSLFFRDAAHGVAVGGDYMKPNDRTGTAAWWDGAAGGWTEAKTPPGGYRSAVGYAESPGAWVSVGPNGSDVSWDGGRTWVPLEHAPAGVPKGGEWNAVSLPWAVGPHGRIGKLNTDLLKRPAAGR